MARRKVTVNRGWAYGVRNFELNFDPVTNPEGSFPILQYQDIQNSDDLVSRETSEWYFERLIIWWRPYFLRGSLLANVNPMVQHRLGVLNDGMDFGVAEAPEMGANLFDRILQEKTIWDTTYAQFSYDGGAVSVSTEATADFTGFPQKPPDYVWDLSSKFSLREDTSLVWQIGSSSDMGGSADHSFGVDLAFKFLLRKRRQ